MKIARWTLLAAALMGGTVATVGAASGADPVRAKEALPVQAVCPSGTYTVVVNGNGEFTPAHVLDSTAIFIPTSFDLVSSGVDSGEPFREIDTAAKAHSARPTETCDIDAHFEFPGGFFDLTGTVTGYFTPQGK